MQHLARPFRTVLYVPGDNVRAIEKARDLPCDAVVFDLEDAVPLEEKVNARAAVLAALSIGVFRAPTLLVRLNGLDTRWGRDDLAAMSAAPARLSGLVIPKVVTPLDLRQPVDFVERSGAPLTLWPMIETCGALFSLLQIAQAPYVGGMILGLNDLGAEMGAQSGPDRAPFQAAMSMTVAAARAAGVRAIDGVFNALEDPDGLEAEARQARSFGFDGKSLIHPNQIALCARAFSPTPEERVAAERMIAAYGAGNGGAVRLDGKMIEKMHVEAARRMLGD